MSKKKKKKLKDKEVPEVQKAKTFTDQDTPDKTKKSLAQTDIKSITESKYDKQDFSFKLEKAIKGLNYISETDAGFSVYIGNKAETSESKSLLMQIKADMDTPTEERVFDEFFERLTTFQDWFDGERIEMTKNYRKLKKLLEDNLRDIKVFKFGEIQIDVYIVGLDSENNLMGVKTEAIET